ncbi:MAG: zinc ribbon domain-containing protein [Candidatus Heimdallarchaeota archaeon]|nr:zinc ribbon domain-containing protein [Candidatus Heimdallarchaeota archaeon]
MKYCNNCGQTISNRTKVCPNCGAKTRNKYDNNVYANVSSSYVKSDQQNIVADTVQTSHIPQKINIGSLLFILIFPGMGQLIAGKKKRGLILMASALILICIAVIVPLTTDFYQTIYFLNPIVALLVIGGIVDAIIQIRKYNQFIDQHGRKPAPSDTW